MNHEILLWVGFNLFILGLLAADVMLFHRKAHAVGIRESLLTSALWIGLALLFAVGIFYTRGVEDGLNFVTAYLVEKSLSVDNLFVFMLIFHYFCVPQRYMHKVLFWGIVGAIIMRTLFIVGGIMLVSMFHWLLYLLGAFLVVTGIKLAVEKDSKIHPEANPIVKIFRKFIPVTSDYDEGHFFVVRNSKYMATPLFIVLIVIETTDVIFAMDSIPAVLAITLDPFIVYTSNIFAILGLRSLYFALSGMMGLFHYLHYGLAAILVFIGVKMLLSGFFSFPIGYALGFIVVALAISVVASLLFPEKGKVVHHDEKR